MARLGMVGVTDCVTHSPAGHQPLAGNQNKDAGNQASPGRGTHCSPPVGWESTLPWSPLGFSCNRGRGAAIPGEGYSPQLMTRGLHQVPELLKTARLQYCQAHAGAHSCCSTELGSCPLPHA